MNGKNLKQNESRKDKEMPADNGRFGASGAVARGQVSAEMTFCGSWQW